MVLASGPREADGRDVRRSDAVDSPAMADVKVLVLARPDDPGLPALERLPADYFCSSFSRR